MAPIRTAIIGLSAKAATSWASAAHLPYFLSPAGKSRYEIIALCNSSVASAKAAIESYKLPANTRAYGSPEDLAADSDVQLVVVSTRVDKHYETALPSVKAGKDVFVEWPLAGSTAQADELTRLAKEKGGKTVLGLQGWFSPPVLKVRELIESDRVGKILSSEVQASGTGKDRVKLAESLAYFTDRKIGGNVVTIGYGHLSDIVQFVLGDIQDVQSRLQIQRPEVQLINPASGEVTGIVKSDVPDLILVTGSLPETDRIVNGASISLRFRRGQAFQGEPALRWTISGEKGEIRLISHSGPGINAISDNVVIEVHDFETDSVQNIAWDWGSYIELPSVARNTGALYDAFASGNTATYADFEHGLRRHRQLDEILTGLRT